MQRAKRVLQGNRYTAAHKPAQRDRVNLEYSQRLNLGDTLSPVIVSWLLEKRGLSLDDAVSGTKHLFAVGSVLGRGCFDATVWGSGILSDAVVDVVRSQGGIRKLDIRAVRGPRTRDVLLDAGYVCPEVYGDPAVLMTEIFRPTTERRVHDLGFVLHHATVIDPTILPAGSLFIDISSNDYEAIIGQIASCGLIISSSLHGIILAESYGVPAIYLWEDSPVGRQRIKFDDWYLSTGRPSIDPCATVGEALAATAPALPDLTEMRAVLESCFPYDLWS